MSWSKERSVREEKKRFGAREHYLVVLAIYQEFDERGPAGNGTMGCVGRGRFFSSRMMLVSID